MTGRDFELDRAAHLRRNGERLNEWLGRGDSRVVPVWRGKAFVRDGSAGVGTMDALGSLVDRGGEIAWLGLLGGSGCFALDVSDVDAPMADAALADLGEPTELLVAAMSLPQPEAALLMYARGMLHWHRHQRFCGKCGAATRSREGGHLRECSRCEQKHFPRTDPAVMVLVTHGDRCLLARQPTFPPGMYSALAGFVEPGESVEACVRRETHEEVGLGLGDVTYFGSQPWPFPQSLMLGYIGETDRSDFRLDGEELEDARWVSRAELAAPAGFYYPPPLSLAHHLIRAFLSAT